MVGKLARVDIGRKRRNKLDHARDQKAEREGVAPSLPMVA